MAEGSPSETSGRYEYDAPSYVVDFKQLEGTDGDDSWFEQQTTGEDLFTPLRPVKPVECDEEPAASKPPPVKTVEDDPSTSTSVSSNIVTCWGAGASANGGARPKTRSSGQPPAQPRRVSKRKGATGTPAQPLVKKQKNSEDHELERIRNLQKEVALRRKRNEASYKAALAGNPPQKKMALSTTVPEEFHFNTDTRARAASSTSAGHDEADSAPHARRGAAYVPMAQAIQQFQKRTPDRYHVPSRQNLEKGPCPVRGDHLKLTQPHSPHLMTRQRSRAQTAKSSDELEAEEVDKLQKKKFKANPLSKKIMGGVVVSLNHAANSSGFTLSLCCFLIERMTLFKVISICECSFKTSSCQQGVPEKKVLLPTVPESPAFALKNRVRVEKVEEVKQPSPVKASQVPHFGLPFQPRLPQKHVVEVCPFSFEERERERRVLKEKKLEENQNVEVPEFKAQQLPCFDTVALPEKKKLEPTKPKPFTLLTDQRGATKTSRQELMVKEEQKLQEEAATFKARPNLVTHKEPFQPKKEHRAAVAVESFELATERRAREWEESKQLASEREAHRALMEEEKRREQEQWAKEEITRLRQEQVHKAQPIRHYKPVALKKSETPLTVPKSPNFSDRFAL
ncbi:targeting protein for Xklp2 isoform X1 [Thunnus albacares]|uniref:targeting protein for Xklp2 isoform X1 n=1 Tax=Thunnus albacares TaxID=8236 RepID=UPI001CF6FDA1|nr:targeting protein for Xklp2 isoform X1 [Thunnus albacares]XP_044206887.1 targeting protein for Xklp2 isoform X1 [Thunnus albacares]